MRETAAKNVQYLHRLTHWPHGYEPARRVADCLSSDGFRRASDGAVHGWYQDVSEAQSAAWRAADGELGEWIDRRADALEDGEALPLTSDGSIADVCR